MHAAQCRMARAALGWEVRDLARTADVASEAIASLERGEALPEQTVAAIRRALEAAGIKFTDGDAPGVRLQSARSGDVKSTGSRRSVGPEDEERGQQAGDLPFNQRDD